MISELNLQSVVYVCPVVVSSLLEQLLEMEANPVAVAEELAAVTVTVVDGCVLAEASRAASLSSASFARFASTPVPAARPMTAAANTAMMMERMKTRNVQPQTVFLLFCGATDSPGA